MAKKDVQLEELMMQFSVNLAALMAVLEKKGFISQKEIMDEIRNIENRANDEFRKN